ncbi:helix-turn-helix transcriptional regulator [Natronorubrum texcoconense]|uniref:helix-turn-helix transcriptional regulator n=1 Tax=Natronorubrum texcoconense TaxID=1095776 RepID=UPI001FE15F7B|nr:MarR family transcriptional regulator [Natronorubrum texcoconense]
MIGSLDLTVEAGGRTERTDDDRSTPDTRHRTTERPTSGGVTDPETGPTSRGEILEYGLSPAAYVRAVVTEHGGRVKQCRFTDEYGWSSSTISRLLSDLEDRNVIERYRIGHEKVVQLPETKATARETSGPQEIRRQ